MSVFSFHTFFVLLYQFLRNEIQKHVNPSLFIQLAKVQQQSKLKRSQEHQSMDPEYVAEQIDSRILELLLKRFCRLIFAPSRKS